jgi:small-conductance mechanosensitive channel
MTEEFDALQLRFAPSLAIGLAIGMLVLGIALEILLRLVERWALSKDKRVSAVILRALHWQPLFWSLLLMAALWLTSFSDISRERLLGTNILSGLLLISLTIVTVRIMTGWFRMVTTKRPSASVSVLGYLVNGLAIIVVISVILWLLNVSVLLLLLTTLGSTIGLSLALRESLSNLFAGIILTASSRVRAGDFVRLASEDEGHVVDIEWDITTIRRLNNSLIIVPNSEMTKAQIINYDQPGPELRVQVAVGVSYDSDLEMVERVTIEVAEGVMRDVRGGVVSHSPTIRYKTFGDSSIGFNVNLLAQRYDDQFRLQHEFVKRLHQRYQEEGIVMPSPTRTLNTVPGEPLTVVIDDLHRGAAPVSGAQAMTMETG